MQWIPPTLSFPILNLPQLQHTPPQNWHPIQSITPQIGVPISDQFVHIFNTPPQNIHCSVELNTRLHIVGEGLSALIRKGRGIVTHRSKSSPTDIVTDMDQGIEMLFRIWLFKHYPHHKIIGEEGVKDKFDYHDITWFIDPIDGTRNFVDNKDDVALLLGAIKAGKPYSSYVGLPFYNRHLSLNDTQHSRVIPNITMRPIAIGSEFFETRLDEAHLFQSILSQFNAKPHRTMSIGVSLLNVWDGKLDLFYKPFLKPWDAIAPLLFIESDPSRQIKIYYWSTVTHTYTPFFPLSPKTISQWTQFCETHCRIGHLLIVNSNLSHAVDDIFNKMAPLSIQSYTS
jgi:fructose-1,6-bisphosphatase/inositol monophosphatase family enzyme